MGNIRIFRSQEHRIVWVKRKWNLPAAAAAAHFL